jgi:hypothetical protein
MTAKSHKAIQASNSTNKSGAAGLVFPAQDRLLMRLPFSDFYARFEFEQIIGAFEDVVKVS